MAWERIGTGTPDGAIRFRVAAGQVRALTLGQKVGYCRVTKIDRLANEVDLLPMRKYATYYDSKRTVWAEE